MLLEYIDTGDALREIGVTTNINESVKYTANTVTTLFSSGPSLINLITGAGNGTLVKTITIKAYETITKGGMYFYVFDGSVSRLVDVHTAMNKIQSATQQSYDVTFELDYYLKAGNILQGYMNNVQSYVITVQGLDMSY